MELSKNQILEILNTNQINKCTKDEKSQVFKFAFGSDFMSSKEKGSLQTYEKKNVY